jgi:hypothetical protein
MNQRRGGAALAAADPRAEDLRKRRDETMRELANEFGVGEAYPNGGCPIPGDAARQGQRMSTMARLGTPEDAKRDGVPDKVYVIEMPAPKRRGGATYHGMVPDDDPIYQNGGWNFVLGRNLNLRAGKAPTSAAEPAATTPETPPEEC